TRRSPHTIRSAPSHWPRACRWRHQFPTSCAKSSAASERDISSCRSYYGRVLWTCRPGLASASSWMRTLWRTRSATNGAAAKATTTMMDLLLIGEVVHVEALSKNPSPDRSPKRRGENGHGPCGSCDNLPTLNTPFPLREGGRGVRSPLETLPGLSCILERNECSLPLSASLVPHKPRTRKFIALEEPKQHVRDLLSPALTRMRPVARQVLAFPDDSVALARGCAVAPEVRAPEQERCLHCAARRVIVEVGVAFDLVLNQPANDECSLVRIWLGIELRVRPAGVDATAK